MPAGSYRLRIEAVGDLDDRHPALSLPFAPVDLELELGAGQVRRVEVPVWTGQRLELTLRGGDSNPPFHGRGRVEVLEPGGWRPVTFYDVESGHRLALPREGRPARSWDPIDPASTRLFIELEGREPIERELELPLDGDLELTLEID